MLSKNLLYTAVTRGKRLVVLVCDPRALEIALSQRRARGPAHATGGTDGVNRRMSRSSLTSVRVMATL